MTVPLTNSHSQPKPVDSGQTVVNYYISSRVRVWQSSGLIKTTIIKQLQSVTHGTVQGGVIELFGCKDTVSECVKLIYKISTTPLSILVRWNEILRENVTYIDKSHLILDIVLLL